MGAADGELMAGAVATGPTVGFHPQPTVVVVDVLVVVTVVVDAVVVTTVSPALLNFHVDCELTRRFTGVKANVVTDVSNE